MSFQDDIKAAVKDALREVLPELLAGATTAAPSGPMSLVAFSRAAKTRPATISKLIRAGKIRADYDPKAHGGKGKYTIAASELAKVRGLK